jgi:hypothetical protein
MRTPPEEKSRAKRSLELLFSSRVRAAATAGLFGVLPALSERIPTYHSDVAPILAERCQECHRSGEIGPMPLTNFREVRPWARAIRESVALRRMPPWFADRSHGSFQNDRSLSEAEIRTITAWVNGGAPEGPTGERKPTASFRDGWRIPRHDVVLQLTEPFTVPPSGDVDYQMFVVPTGFTEDKWVEAIEVRPGNRAIVHHVVVFAREPGSPFWSHLKPGVATASPDRRPERPPDTGAGMWSVPNRAEHICTYVPGGDPCVAPPGQARFIKAGSDLVIQMHYVTTGTAASDQTQIGMAFAGQRPTQRVWRALIKNENLRIPPGAGNHPVFARVELAAPAAVTSLMPHMHLRGKAFQYRALLPTGESEVLLKVPRYDFNWQMTYRLKEPRLLPKGTVIECTAWFDNSKNNPANPDPTVEVRWGNQTSEEMMAGFLDLTFDVALDPAVLFEGQPVFSPEPRVMREDK